MDDPRIAEVEWEPLGHIFRVPLDRSTRLGSQYRLLELSRGPEQELVAVVRGTVEDVPAPMGPWDSGLAGQPIEPEPDLELSAGSSAWKIRFRSPAPLGRPGFRGRDLQLPITAHGVRIEIQSSSGRMPRWCSVWCLNGPRELIFSRETKRRTSLTYERRREDTAADISVDDEPLSWGLAWDFMKVPGLVAGSSAIFARAADDVAPQEFNPHVLEFEMPADQTVTWESLSPFLAALGFAIGRRLIAIGFTVFDSSWSPIVHELRSAWTQNLRRECGNRSYPPISRPMGEPVDEDMISGLVSMFRVALVDYPLTEATWRLHYAESTFLEVALPHCAASLESIMNAWFRSRKSRSQRRYLKEKDWSEISREPLELLEQKLVGMPFVKRIVGRAAKANEFGVNESFPKFLDELGLRIGAVEDRAFHARNKGVHGGAMSGDDYFVLLSNLRAYQTLVHRVLLRVMGWEDEYIDYSTHGHPTRQLNEALGGPRGDGVAARTRKPSAP